MDERGGEGKEGKGRGREQKPPNSHFWLRHSDIKCAVGNSECVVVVVVVVVVVERERERKRRGMQ